MNYLKINQTNTCRFGEIDTYKYFFWPPEPQSLFLKISLIEALRLESHHAEKVEFEDIYEVVECNIDQISISL